MEMPEVEMGNNTVGAKESWEGLGAEDEEGADKENENKDESEGEGEGTGEDLVSETFS